MPINAFSDFKEAKEEAENYKESGYIAKVESVSLYLNENAIARIWRTRQKQLEKTAMLEG